MPDIKIEIDNVSVREAFNRLIAQGEDPSQELDAIGRVLKTNIQRGFYGIERSFQPCLDPAQNPPR